jgi:hypothetical protein
MSRVERVQEGYTVYRGTKPQYRATPKNKFSMPWGEIVTVVLFALAILLLMFV